MKNKMKKCWLIWLLLIGVLLISCSSDSSDDNPISLIPTTTNTGTGDTNSNSDTTKKTDGNDNGSVKDSGKTASDEKKDASGSETSSKLIVQALAGNSYIIKETKAVYNEKYHDYGSCDTEIYSVSGDTATEKYYKNNELVKTKTVGINNIEHIFYDDFTGLFNGVAITWSINPDNTVKCSVTMKGQSASVDISSTDNWKTWSMQWTQEDSSLYATLGIKSTGNKKASSTETGSSETASGTSGSDATGEGAGTVTGNAQIAAKTLKGSDINKILIDNLGAASTAKYFKPSAVAPESSVQTYTINTAINAVLYRSSTTIYYYAKGYTDSNKGIPLNSNCFNMFKSCKSLLTIDMTGFDTSNVTNMCSMINECDNLRSVDLSKFNTSKVTNMSWMFSGSKNIISLDLSSFDTRNVTDMSGMFCDLESIVDLDVSSFNTSNVTNMNMMFCCVYKLSSLNVSHFNTSKVTNMSNMFANMRSVVTLNVSNFDTSNVTDMSFMFAWNKKLKTIDCSSFNTSKVTNFGGMFAGIDELTELDLSKFDFSKATILSVKSDSDDTWFGMFYYSVKLKTIYVAPNTDLSGIKTSENLFISCHQLEGGSGTTYDYNHCDASYAHVDGGTANPGYFSVKN